MKKFDIKWFSIRKNIMKATCVLFPIKISIAHSIDGRATRLFPSVHKSSHRQPLPPPPPHPSYLSWISPLMVLFSYTHMRLLTWALRPIGGGRRPSLTNNAWCCVVRARVNKMCLGQYYYVKFCVRCARDYIEKEMTLEITYLNILAAQRNLELFIFNIYTKQALDGFIINRTAPKKKNW